QAMLPAGMELRTGLPHPGEVVALGFPRENMPDPLRAGTLHLVPPGIVLPRPPPPGAQGLGVAPRHVGHIPVTRISSLQSLRPALLDRPANGVLVVRDEATLQDFVVMGMTDQPRAVVGEAGLRFWWARMVQDEEDFSEENIRRMIEDNITMDDVME